MRDRSTLATALSAALLAACALGPPSVSGYSAAAQEGIWACTLSGAQALPPNSSLATGECELRLRGERIHVKLFWRGLSRPVVRVDFHGPADAREEGPILWSLVPGVGGPETPSPLEGEFAMTHTQGDLLREGRVFADIHTALFPRGEIRGRVLRRAQD